VIPGNKDAMKITKKTQTDNPNQLDMFMHAPKHAVAPGPNEAKAALTELLEAIKEGYASITWTGAHTEWYERAQSAVKVVNAC